MATLDMAGIITRICTKLKTKFSKVSIGQISSSGSHIAAITIDGIKYDLWAPTPPSASAVLPKMDGVASAGSNTGAASGYSRGNHVHPTDTSRQAKITASGLLKGDGNGGVSAAVPGTDYTLLPSVTSADDGKVLTVINGAWAAGSLPVYNGEIVEPAHSVTVTVQQASGSEYFTSFTIRKYDSTTQTAGDVLGSLSSPTGSTTVEVSGTDKIIIEIRCEDIYADEEHILCTDGVVLESYNDSQAGADVIFQVSGDGTITFTSIIYG